MKSLLIFAFFFPLQSFAQSFEGVISYQLYFFTKGDTSKQVTEMLHWRYYFKYPYVLEEMENKEGKKIIKSIYNHEKQQTKSFCDGKICRDKLLKIDYKQSLPKNIKKINDTIIQNTNTNHYIITKENRPEKQHIWIDKNKYKDIHFPIAPIIGDDSEFTMFNPYLKGLPIRIETPIPIPEDIKKILTNTSNRLIQFEVSTFMLFELQSIKPQKIDNKIFDSFTR